MDTAGVALAAIQALKAENDEQKAQKDSEIAELKTQNYQLKQELEIIKSHLGL